MPKGVTVTVSELIKLRHAARGLSLGSRRRTVMNRRIGAYLSRFRGRGIDFDEVRNYQPGDDIRTIDWRVTARTGKPHTKLFREERERTVLLVVDYSASMQFGSKVAFKSVIAAQVATLLAWTAMADGDQVGGLIFAEHFHQELAPQTGQASILHLLNALATTPKMTEGYQDAYFSHALHRLAHVAKPGSLIFIISDFYRLNEQTQSILGRLAQHNDIAAVCIYDQLEQSLPSLPGFYTFAAEDSSRIIINTADQTLKQAYTHQFEQRQAQLQHFMQSLNMPLLNIATDQKPRKILAQYWTKRKRG